MAGRLPTRNDTIPCMIAFEGYNFPALCRPAAKWVRDENGVQHFDGIDNDNYEVIIEARNLPIPLLLRLQAQGANHTSYTVFVPAEHVTLL